MDIRQLRPMKKNEAKKVLEGDMVPFFGYYGHEERRFYYKEAPRAQMTPGKEYEVINCKREKGNNIYFDVKTDNGRERKIHRRFFGVKK